MIKIELEGTTTIVSELVGNDGSAVLQKHAINKALNYSASSGPNLEFFGNDKIGKLAIRFDNLTASTNTLLGGAAADQNELVEKIAAANLFEGK